MPEFGQLIGQIVGPVGALVLAFLALWLWYRGKIHSDPEFQREVGEKLEWRKLYFAQADIIAEMREVGKAKDERIAVQTERADAAVRAAEVTNRALEELQRHALPRGERR